MQRGCDATSGCCCGKAKKRQRPSKSVHDVPWHAPPRSFLAKTDMRAKTAEHLGNQMDPIPGHAGTSFRLAKPLLWKLNPFSKAVEERVRRTLESFLESHLQTISGMLSEHFRKTSVKDFSEPITFWLDAHDDQETTDRGGQHDAPKKPCPLLEELAAIARHPLRTHTILIDDWGCFAPGFTHSKHTWFAGIHAEEVRECLQKINPDYRIFTIDGLRKDDILVAQLPKLID